ncbi:carbohydrate binding domain-containing protein [Hymenobacter armeniacus]|uniref:Carbohydrate binding domain-containing protein n=1 Tax=Hymenobacter armeniacus TaxID=2771358 RepID=A0ABR8JXZ1_9BACT|nr:carbohydrate binding domain-containing protein [Hymenobacter armeniacus]MBD2723437.1 carbohydrate binding domain-containing protein [Hymenobacter armeniacus]
MKNLYSLLLGLAGGAWLLASCSSKGDTVTKGTLVTRNDFESVLGWGGNADASITTEQAHSGTHAVKVGPQGEYAYTYIQNMGKMSNAKIKDLTVSAWVWLPNQQASSSLVVAINHSAERGTPVFYKTIVLPTSVKKFKEWQLVTETFALPDSVQATNQLKCYLWGMGTKENVYADDITISVGN